MELQDPSDMLRYAIVDPYTSNSAVPGPFSPSALKFTVEPETGVIRAQPDILPGLHRFNVSVTDGRYIVHAPVTVDISNIDQVSALSLSYDFPRITCNFRTPLTTQ